MHRLSLVLVFLFSVISTSISSIPVTAEPNIDEILINEIQTGGLDELLHEDGKQEFIELYNQSIEPADITGWKLQYFSATRLDVFDINASPTRELVVLDGVLSSKGFVLFSYEGFISNADGFFGQGSTATSGLLARSGGHIRLITPQGVLSDVVGWGTAKSPETKALTEINAGFSVERKVTEGMVTDTNNNFEDFIVLSTTTPQGGALVEIEPQVEPDPVIPLCEGLVISELLPNPDGTDTGQEFIELHNPTEADVYLEDCILMTTASTKQYVFPIGSLIQAKQYKAFYNNITDLTLANAAGGEVTLIGTNADYAVTYPADVAANHSWSLINGSWHNSLQPTPNNINILPPAEVLGTSDEVESLEPCGPGKYRSTETNRCRNTPTASAVLAACAVGQTRNPETNRCRNATTLAASLIPCREGQERNPETNRCRTSTTASPTTCQQGYERNPETNRCKKAAVTLASSPSVGDSSDTSGGRLNYAFLTVMSILVAGYGVYEYRRDISNLFVKFQARKLAKAVVK